MPDLTAILGAGAWGTTLAVILARAGHDVVLCVRTAGLLQVMERLRENPVYLPGVELPERLALTVNWNDAAARAETVVMAVPSRFARSAMASVAGAVTPGTTLVSATKGIEAETLATMTEMLAEVVPGNPALAVLSGPGFAVEVAHEKPAALVAAAHDDSVARAVQGLFACRSLRIYRSTDVRGVELAGAAKNVIAIGAGVSDGLGLGSSARAAVITRGLAELMRLAAAAGARRETIAGLAGLGDLVLTCTGDASRNRTLGLAIGRGAAPPDPRQPPAPGRPVAEGVVNARAVRALALRLGVDMPLVDAVYRILYEGQAPKAMVEELLSRELKAEFQA